MDGFVVHEVAADLVVRIGRAMPELPATTDREVEQLWQAACRRAAAGGAGQLFNGRVCSADTITPHLVTGHLTEYRRVVAQMERPELFAIRGPGQRQAWACGRSRSAGCFVAPEAWWWGGGIRGRSISRGCGNWPRPAVWMPAP